MDPLSITAAIVAFLHVARDIKRWTNQYMHALEDSKKLFEKLCYLESYLEGLLHSLNGITDVRWFKNLLRLTSESGERTLDGNFHWQAARNPGSPMTRLYLNLEDLSKLVIPTDNRVNNNSSTMIEKIRGESEKGLQRIKWLRNKEKIYSHLDEVMKARDDIDSEILSGQIPLMQNINTHAERIDIVIAMLDKDKEEKRRDMERSEKETVEQWLTPLSFHERLDTILENSFPIKWILDTVAFQRWVVGQPWYLICRGVPGSGKTGVAAFVIDHLRKKYQQPKVPILYLLLDNKGSKAQTLVALLASLLKQLLQLKTSESAPLHLKELWRRAKSRMPLLSEVYNTLQTELEGYNMVYIVVDALDECSCRDELMRRLRQLRKAKPQKLSVMVTTRRDDVEDSSREKYCNVCQDSGIQVYFHCSICDNGDFDLCESCKGTHNSCTRQSHKLKAYCIPIEVRATPEDLRQYVKSEIGKVEDDGSDSFDDQIYSSNPNSSKFRRRLKKHPELLEKIPEIVIEKAEARFLWAKLYMDSLQAKQNYRQIKEALDGYPNVDNLYQDAMRRIQSQQDKEDQALGLKTLSLMVCAHRPLSLEELLQALAIDPGTSDIDEDKDFDKEGILRATAGLISIDSDGGAVRLHSTLQDYLIKTLEQWFPEAELDMAVICMTFLSFVTFSKPCRDAEGFNIKKRRYPFIAYASQYWGDHVRDAGSTPSLVNALTIVSDEMRVATCIQAAFLTDKGYAGWDVDRGVDGLHLCAWFGFSSYISTLQQEDEDDFEVDVLEPTYKQTPLMYACRRGKVEVIEMLLSRGASVAIFSARGRTALMEAIVHGQEEVVDFLLEKKPKGLDINVVLAKEYNRTPLMLAVHHRYGKIVDSLLAYPDIKVNQEDSYGRTALCLAASNGSYNIAQSLLETPGVDVNRAESIAKRSPLILSAQEDHSDVVDLLLSHGADSNLQDDRGGTAMLRVTELGRVSTLQTMVNHGVNISCVDENGRTLMHGASEGGWPDVVRFLHEKKLAIDVKDKNGLTPLHVACQMGKSKISEVLLELGADQMLKDNFDRTPLTVAWQHGHLEIMNVLQSNLKGNLQPPTPLTSLPNPETLPAWSLATLGLSDLLFVKPKIKASLSSSSEPTTGNTLLHCAVLASQIPTLHSLCTTTPLLDPDRTNKFARTPLHLAALTGNLLATRALIAANASLDELDRWGAEPLFLAQSKKRWDVALELIEAGASVDVRRIGVQRMLFRGIEGRRAKAVEVLLRLGADARGKEDGVSAMQMVRDVDDKAVLGVLEGRG